MVTRFHDNFCTQDGSEMAHHELRFDVVVNNVIIGHWITRPNAPLMGQGRWRNNHS